MTAGKPVLLLVEDDPQTLQVMRTFAQDLGYQVRPAISGRAALNFAKTTVPDIVLLDYLMPDIDGLEVCRRLRKLRTFADVPILFVSIIDDASDVVRCLEAGATDYIPKPVAFEVLRARMTMHLLAAENRRTLKAQHEELAEAHKQLRALETLRDTYANMIVHDLRSPLGAISLSLELLGLECPGDRQAHLIQGARTACDRAMRLTDSVLTASKLEATEIHVAKCRLPLAQWVQNTLNGLPQLLHRRPIEVSVPETLTADCDGELLSRVLENLLHNADRFAPPGTQILVEAGQAEGAVWIAVEDDGPGIAIAKRSVIFQKFQQVDDSQPHGFGMGLAFCRLAVNAHNGTIEATDARHGRGARLVITLPS